MIKNAELGERTNIEEKVMRRVYIVRTLRPLVSSGTLSALILIVALWGIGRDVWVARVLENMPHNGNPMSFSQFWLAAFSHTRFTVQALALLTFASVIYLAREMVRAFSSFLTPARI